ncbi:MAG: hypothetical protein NZL93_03805, partial [Chthoniobacterales bacterium]|nr:hypothetical protein [Chthoniobacterales bacterium]
MTNGSIIIVRNLIFLFLALVLAFMISGCATKVEKVASPLPGRTSQTAIKSRVSDKILQQPVFNPQQISGQGLPTYYRWPRGFVRIAMLPIFTEVPTGGALDDLDQIFRAECAKLLDLEIVHVSRYDMLSLLGKEQIASTAIIPEFFLKRLREVYDVQGVLFTDLTIFRPYRPINIGVRAKLVQIPS